MIRLVSQRIRTVEGGRETPRRASTLIKALPFSSVDWVWEYPAERNKRIQIVANGKERLVDVMEIGALTPFRFTDVS